MPRDVASRNAKAVCDEGRGVGDSGLAVYLDFTDAIARVGDDVIAARYGNLFDMYRKITDEDPYQVPMRIYPAVHYTMGGLWVDYNLMSNLPGLHVLGEANFSDHGANRLGASALMQGLCDGYFVIPYTLAHYLGSTALPAVTTDDDAFRDASDAVQARIDRLLSVKGDKTPRQLHRELGAVLWDPHPLGAPDRHRDQRHVGRLRHPHRAALEVLELERPRDGGLGEDPDDLAGLECLHRGAEGDAPAPRSTGMWCMPRISGPLTRWWNTCSLAMNRTRRFAGRAASPA